EAGDDGGFVWVFVKSVGPGDVREERKAMLVAVIELESESIVAGVNTALNLKDLIEVGIVAWQGLATIPTSIRSFKFRAVLTPATMLSLSSSITATSMAFLSSRTSPGPTLLTKTHTNPPSSPA